MPGNPGQRPVEATVSGSATGLAVPTNLTKVAGTSVQATAAALGAVPVGILDPATGLPAPIATSINAVTLGQVTTYSASKGNTTPASSATDVFTLTGSGSAVIRITRVWISGTASSDTQLLINLTKRSTGNTGGTATTQAGIARDSTSGAAVATFRTYTANPTTGSTVGVVQSAKIQFPGTGKDPGYYEFNFGACNNVQPIVLRGTSELLAINLTSTTVTGGDLAGGFEWTEASS